MSDEFPDDWVNHPSSSRELERSSDFAWEEVEAEAEGEISDEEMRRLREAFIRVMQWQLKGIRKPSRGGPSTKARTIGIRAIALAWVLNPEIIGGRRNAAAIARDLGVSRKTMSVVISQARQLLRKP